MSWPLLNKEFLSKQRKLKDLPERVLQFGTGVLLRGLPDFFIHHANERGIFNGKIVVVKSTANGDIANFSSQDNLFTHCLRGVYHGELDNFSPEQIVLMIGTNNLQFNTNEEIIEGLQLLISAIHLKQPKSTILMMGILPRRGMEERVVQVNKLINKLSSKEKITYADAGKLFVQGADKKIDESLFSDGLHPNEKGYDLLGAFIVAKGKN